MQEKDSKINDLEGKKEELCNQLKESSQMIQWLNKTINEKEKGSLNFGKPQTASKPPSQFSNFKPTFASIEQIGSTPNLREGSPFRQTPQSYMLNTSSQSSSQNTSTIQRTPL